jgi:hypothetical protein
MDFKANINFGKAKNNLLINTYNWRVSYPNQMIYLTLANITACFRFPRISADVTGAFRFMAEDLSTSHVFGSNTSGSSWEPFQQAIQHIIPIYTQRNNLVEKHKKLLDTLRWDNTIPDPTSIMKALLCKLNKGVLDENRNLLPMTANIYVDNILGATVSKELTLKLLVAVTEGIFLVRGQLDEKI